MLVKETCNRIIAKMEIKNRQTVKGVMLEGVEAVGDPLDLCRKYYRDGIDEFFILDTVASLYNRNEVGEIISKLVEEIFIPVCAGGGIKSLDDAAKLLNMGADKVCLNTAAVENPRLLGQLANSFGSSSVVCHIDTRKINDNYWIFTNSGRDIGKFTLWEWIDIVTSEGVGEIVFTSIAHDGLQKGIDIELIELIEHIKIPIVYSGGITTLEDFTTIFRLNNCGACLASSLHHKKMNIAEIKHKLSKLGLQIRLNNEN